MKKVLFIVVLFIGFNTFSQKKRSVEERANRVVKDITKELTLTEDQASKLKVYILPFVTESTGKMNQGKIPTVKEMTDYYDGMKIHFKNTLTEEQFEKFSNQMYPSMIESAKAIGAKE